MGLVNAEAAAVEVGLNPFTVRRLGASRKIHVYRHGTAVRFDPDEIREYMRNQGAERPVLVRARAHNESKNKTMNGTGK